MVTLPISHLGQRDKPFVRDDEHDVRTPRPDLFERPYPQEFGGDALRKVNFFLLIQIEKKNEKNDFFSLFRQFRHF